MTSDASQLSVPPSALTYKVIGHPRSINAERHWRTLPSPTGLPAYIERPLIFPMPGFKPRFRML